MILLGRYFPKKHIPTIVVDRCLADDGAAEFKLIAHNGPIKIVYREDDENEAKVSSAVLYDGSTFAFRWALRFTPTNWIVNYRDYARHNSHNS